jgi:lysine 6-dehydrogenase
LKVVVLGGAGAMGRVIVRSLLQSPEVDLVSIADIDAAAAQRFANQLRSDRTVALKADARDSAALRRLIGRHDVVVNSTWYELNVQTMRSSIDAGVPYCDLGGLYHVTLKQLQLDDAAKDAGVTCVVGIGSTPGTMNVMAAHAASKVAKIAKVKLRSGSANVGKSSKTFRPPYSIRTVLDEFTLPAMVLRNGRMKQVPALSGKEDFVLPKPVNEVEGYYTLHSELATLPKNLGRGVQEMDFIVAYPPDFTRTVATLVEIGLASKVPLRVAGRDIAPYDVLVATVDAGPREDQELDVDVQRVELWGEDAKGEKINLRYDSISMPNAKWGVGGGAVGTGTPPSVAARWLASGKISAKGVLPPELCIDPLPFFKELRKREIKTYEYSQGSARLI